MLADIVCLLL